jgi:FMN phosphatase YigB (HAD superfamily)
MIRNVVFDVGGVMLRLRYQPFVRYLQEAGADLSDLPSWLATIGLEEHERGEIPGEELLGRVAATAREPLDAADLHRRWLDMFERTDAMFELAEGLMARHRVYLLSNVGDLHWAHMDREYGIERVGHGAIASFRVGAIKPQPEIYRIAEQRLGLDPRSTVFVDDLARNVAGARACGWTAIHHVNPAMTRESLASLGVRVGGGG